MKVFNIILVAFITLLSYTIADGSSGSSSGSMPKSLQSKDDASASSTASVASSTASSSAQSSSGSSQVSSTSSAGSSGSSGSSSHPKITSSSGSSGMPQITTTADSGSNSTSSSYTVTFTPIVPTASNPEIQMATLPQGTTFIAVGGVLGVVFSVLIVTRLIMAFISFQAAKKGKMAQNQQKEFDYDPSLFQEKDLKKHTSRASIYSLGSTSTLNVLGSQASMEQMIAPSGRSLRTALMNNNSRASMFISPTEMLANQHIYNNRGFEDQGYLSYDSPIESPSTGAYTHTPTHSTFDNLQDANRDGRKVKSRPPSVFMEQLFDDDDESIRSGYEYDSEAHNKV